MAKTKVHGEYLDPSVISGQTQVTAVGADSVLIFDATDNALKKALLSDVIETVGSTPTFSQINATSDLTVDAGGDIILDADGADVLLKDGGTQFGRIGKGGGSDLIINASIADKDIIFSGTDGSTAIDALVLDMSDAGSAIFNSHITINNTGSDRKFAINRTGGKTFSIEHDTSRFYIYNVTDSSLHTSFANTGNLGIGTASPSTLLHLDGTTNHTYLTIEANSGVGNAIKFVGSNTWTLGNDTASGVGDNNFALLDGSDIRVTVDTSGNVGIGDTNPQHPLKVHLTNGEVAMFGSNGMNSPGQYAGIGLGQVLANNTTYQKVKLVAEGRNSGSYIQDFHILVDTVADPNSAVLSDAKLTIDGGTGAVTHPKQPSFNAYGPQVTSGDNTIIFGSERHDTGGDYNTSTGIFTAPVAGVYQFHVYILMDPGNNEYGRVLFRINNTGSSMEQYGDNLTYQAGQPAYFGLGLSLVLYMAANDNIRVHNSGQWYTYGSSYGAFSGHLIG